MLSWRWSSNRKKGAMSRVLSHGPASAAFQPTCTRSRFVLNRHEQGVRFWQSDFCKCIADLLNRKLVIGTFDMAPSEKRRNSHQRCHVQHLNNDKSNASRRRSCSSTSLEATIEMHLSKSSRCGSRRNGLRYLWRCLAKASSTNWSISANPSAFP